MICMLILSGCGSNDGDLPQRVLDQLAQIPEQQLSAGSNHTKQFYAYYLPADMGRRDSNQLSEILIKDGYRMIMNFDPSALIIEQYYTEKQEDEPEPMPIEKKDLLEQFVEPQMMQEDTTWIYTGNYLTSSLEIYPYTVQLIQNEDAYLLYFDGTLIKLYTYVPEAAVSSMLKSMITIASSLEYEKEAVLKTYSLKSLEENRQETLNYLEHNLPSTGSLQDLLEPKSQNRNQGDMPK